MFKIVNDHEIHITRGDSAIIDVTIKNPDGTDYEIKMGDRVDFTVKEAPPTETSEPLIHKEGLPIVLNPEDTKALDFGKYCFDIQVTQENGDVSTIIAYPTVFWVKPEVTL